MVHYTKDKNEIAYQVTSNGDGLTDERLGEIFGVGFNTVKRWQREYPEFKSAVQAGRDYWNTTGVESALKNAALGYMTTETKTESVELDGVSQGDRRNVKVKVPATKTVVMHKHVPANVIAQIFWLKNRAPERWADVTKQEHVHDHKHKYQMDLTVMSNDELGILHALVEKASNVRDNDNGGYARNAQGEIASA